MLLDSQSGFRALHGQFIDFLKSAMQATSFSAETTGNPAPADEFLNGLRVLKGGEVPSGL